jgi:class 3 adenylate cyclase/tetratricopeptide (TPR) repeat protein
MNEAGHARLVCIVLFPVDTATAGEFSRDMKTFPTKSTEVVHYTTAAPEARTRSERSSVSISPSKDHAQIIVTNSSSTDNSSRAGEIAEVLSAIGDREHRKLPELLSIWRSRDIQLWRDAPELYRMLGTRMLELGEPLMAYDILAEGLHHRPADLRMSQLYAWALSGSGAVERANDILLQLLAHGNRDEETYGMPARTHKDLWLLARNPAEKREHLARAFELYSRGYQSTHGYYPGINAATLALVSGQSDLAHRLAREVRQICLGTLSAGADASNQYYPVATLAEAALILGESAEAEQWYARAGEIGRGQYGELNSTLSNARLITNHLGIDLQPIARHFRIPTVVLFSGHMIDQPGRPEARFSAEMEPLVRDAIRSRLERLDGWIGYSSAACGSDILFCEALLDEGGEIHIVLPYNMEQFAAESVEIVPDGNWRRRFDSVLERATDVMIASDQKMGSDSMSFEYTNLLLHGLAAIRAWQLQTRLVGLAVWDRSDSGGTGGTASAVREWEEADREIEVIDIDALAVRRPTIDAGAVAPSASLPEPEEQEGLTAEIIAILFADVPNFSRLTEEELPRFVRSFLGRIGELADGTATPPVIRNTWGDGLYFVFENVRDAGVFALELCDSIDAVDWRRHGLPRGMSLRIALHAGPAYSCIDPVTGNPNYIGGHVNRAARIEPITPPGQVYASQAFAALAAARQVTEFSSDYVGQMPLAKEHGTFPTYLLRRIESHASINA